jgi:TonB-dependent receptor
VHEDLGGLLDLNWQLNLSQTERNQPDTRQTYYVEGPEGFEYDSAVGGGEHLYTTLTQDDVGGGLDLNVPWATFASTKVGYMTQLSEREFSARRFGSQLNTNNLSAEDRLLPIHELLSPENAGELWQLQELTVADIDGFAAEQDLHAVYAMAELSPFKRLKATGGVRFESARQLIEAKSPVVLVEEPEDGTFQRTRRVNKDFLPAAGLVFTLQEDMFLRAAYGGTIARPLVRELSPFQSRDFVRRRSTSGNPDLKRTYIQNFDLRWEMFPSTTEVLAVSAFYKQFEDPIETVIRDVDGSNLGYQNIKEASNFGLELEARARLDILDKSLEAFTTMANLALIRSEVNLSEEEGRNATSLERPLAGQSPYVLNLGLGFEPADTGFSTFVYYNVFGRRIIEVGTSGLPDVYEEPFHSLDWTGYYEINKNFSVSLSASNLLLQESVFTQGPLEQSRSQKGLSVGAGASYSY